MAAMLRLQWLAAAVLPARCVMIEYSCKGRTCMDALSVHSLVLYGD
jgi:hypothetical protein